MDPDSAAEENTRWMMAYQASAYNGCCNVYAPRYREATIFSYFQDEPLRDELLGFAYGDVERAPASENVGAVPVSIPYNISFEKDNTPRGVEFTELKAPIENHTWAQCRDGTLFVADQSEGPFSNSARGGNYHGLDYALFYMDIRENAIDRVNAYMAAMTTE